MEATGLVGGTQDGRGQDPDERGAAASQQLRDPGLHVLLCDPCDWRAFHEMSPAMSMSSFGLEDFSSLNCSHVFRVE